MKKLEITEENAIKAYNAGCSDTRKVLINLFGKDTFEPKDATDEISGIKDIYKKLSCDPDKDIIKIDGFDEGQTNVVKALVKKMRVCEAYNGKKKLLLTDKRYYNWYIKSGSGLVFDDSGYHDVHAGTSSAARLSFGTQKHLDDARKKFPELDLDILDFK